MAPPTSLVMVMGEDAPSNVRALVQLLRRDGSRGYDMRGGIKWLAALQGRRADVVVLGRGGCPRAVPAGRRAIPMFHSRQEEDYV
jgi:hypothetical protein